MISTIKIKNFKSIKDLKINCKKINLFIGEPNVGKSNILECLALISMVKYSKNYNLNIVRFNQLVDLIYNQDFTKNVNISVDDLSIQLERKSEDQFLFTFNQDNNTISLNYNRAGELTNASNTNKFVDKVEKVKFYRFVNFPEMLQKNEMFLLPPLGENLLTVISKNKHIEDLTKQSIAKYGLRLITDRSDNRIKLLKDEGDEIVALPFKVMSDGLQRHLFNLAALLSNKNSTIVIEEPESHTFPFLTKDFAEFLVDDENNQFFFTTHNPYFITSILEKAKKEELAIFVVFFDDFQTKIKSLEEHGMQKLLHFDYDLFFNIEDLIHE